MSIHNLGSERNGFFLAEVCHIPALILVLAKCLPIQLVCRRVAAHLLPLPSIGIYIFPALKNRHIQSQLLFGNHVAGLRALLLAGSSNIENFYTE